ncbi:hypothetical protein [Streptomyces sp. NPDC003299]
MAQKPAPKHLTITIDFDLTTEGSTITYQRAAMAYDKAVAMAIEGAKQYLPEAAIREITSEMDWSYRWYRRAHPQYKRTDSESGPVQREDDVTEDGFDPRDEV